MWSIKQVTGPAKPFPCCVFTHQPASGCSVWAPRALSWAASWDCERDARPPAPPVLPGWSDWVGVLPGLTAPESEINIKYKDNNYKHKNVQKQNPPSTSKVLLNHQVYTVNQSVNQFEYISKSTHKMPCSLACARTIVSLSLSFMYLHQQIHVYSHKTSLICITTSEPETTTKTLLSLPPWSWSNSDWPLWELWLDVPVSPWSGSNSPTGYNENQPHPTPSSVPVPPWSWSNSETGHNVNTTLNPLSVPVPPWSCRVAAEQGWCPWPWRPCRPRWRRPSAVQWPSGRARRRSSPAGCDRREESAARRPGSTGGVGCRAGAASCQCPHWSTSVNSCHQGNAGGGGGGGGERIQIMFWHC